MIDNKDNNPENIETVSEAVVDTDNTVEDLDVTTSDNTADEQDSTSVSAEEDSAYSETKQKNEANNQLNFRALRQAKKQAEKERDEFATRLKEIEARNSSVAEKEDVLYADDDDLSITKKEVRELKSQWAAQQNRIKTQNIEQKLKSEFPDLEEIVNEDNIEVLKARDPSFAKIVNRAPSDPDELYHRAVTAYTLIKKYGIYVKDNHESDRKRVEKNMSKPRPASTASASGSGGLAEFSQFSNMNTEERRKAIFKLARERANN